MGHAVLEAPPIEATPAIIRLRELSSSLDLEERSLYGFFNQSTDLLAIISADGMFVRVNASWQKILGWDEYEIIQKPWLHLIHPSDIGKVREVVGHLVAHDLDRFHCRVQCHDNRYIVVEFSATKWVNGRSNLIGRVVPDACLDCPNASPRLNWRPHACNTTKQGG